MSLQKYVAFLKTVELGSISLAAEQMGYTQSAVSRMILDLEKEWGMELLHRSRAGIALSSVGEHLLPAIRSIVADCEELKFAVNERLQASPTCGFHRCWFPFRSCIPALSLP